MRPWIGSQAFTKKKKKGQGEKGCKGPEQTLLQKKIYKWSRNNEKMPSIVSLMRSANTNQNHEILLYTYWEGYNQKDR
jgi:hypothetical protein